MKQVIKLGNNNGKQKSLNVLICMVAIISASLVMLHSQKNNSKPDSKPDTYVEQTTIIPDNTPIDTQSSEPNVNKQNTVMTDTYAENTEAIDKVINTNEELRSLSYRYNALSDKEKLLYAQICNAIRAHVEECDIEGDYTFDDVNNVSFVVQFTDEYMLAVNHASVGSLYDSSTHKAKKLKISYSCSKEEADEKYTATMNAVEEIINKTGGLTPYEAELYIHNTIVENNEYLKEGDESHSAYNALVQHRSVCDGYAKSFKIICNRINIPCDIIIGMATSVTSSESEGHAWNIVTLDNEDYIVDVTYDDVNPMDPDYSFFNITQEECDKMHTPSDEFKFPPATGEKYNYYIKENCVVDSYETFCEVFDNNLRYAIDGKTPCIHLKAKAPYTINDIMNGEKEWAHISDVLNRLSLNYMQTSVASDDTVTIYLIDSAEGDG